jgi:hypothetical protein
MAYNALKGSFIMHTYSKSITALFLLSLTQYAFANPVWQCFAFNSRHQSYEGQAYKQKIAMKIAKRHCLKANNKYGRCKTADSFCYNLTSSLRKQECIATDIRGKSFTSRFCKEAVAKCLRWQYKYGMSRRGSCVAKFRRL